MHWSFSTGQTCELLYCDRQYKSHLYTQLLLYPACLVSKRKLGILRPLVYLVGCSLSVWMHIPYWRKLLLILSYASDCDYAPFLVVAVYMPVLPRPLLSSSSPVSSPIIFSRSTRIFLAHSLSIYQRESSLTLSSAKRKETKQKKRNDRKANYYQAT